ncbi:MAG: MFS transporter [Actinobacteria bacterium]|nr:MFS transporter [Actinomycetota bacterium]
MSSVFSPFLKDAGLGFSDIGLVIAIYAFVSLCVRIPGSLLYSRWDRTWIMRVSLVLMAASVAGYALSPSSHWVSISRTAHGLANGLATTVNFANFMALAARDRQRGRAMGAFAASQSGGRALGNFLGGVLADRIGFSGAFAIAALFPLLAAIMLPSSKHLPEIRVPATRVERPRVRFRLRERLRQIGNLGVVTQTVLGFCINFLYELISSYFPLYALASGLSLTSIGTMKGLNSACGIITRPFTGELTRFLGYDVITNAGILLGASLIALMPSFHDFWPLTLILIAAGVTRGAVSVTNGLAMIEATERQPEKRATAAAVYKTGQDLGNIVGPVVGGVLITYVGLPGMLRFAPWLVIGVYIALVVMTRAYRRPTGEAPAPTIDQTG